MNSKMNEMAEEYQRDDSREKLGPANSFKAGYQARDEEVEALNKKIEKLTYNLISKVDSDLYQLLENEAKNKEIAQLREEIEKYKNLIEATDIALKPTMSRKDPWMSRADWEWLKEQNSLLEEK